MGEKIKSIFEKLIKSRQQVAELKGEIIRLQEQLKEPKVVESVVVENKTSNILEGYAEYKKLPDTRNLGKPTELIVIDYPTLTNERLDELLIIDGSVRNAFDRFNQDKKKYEVNLEISRRDFVLYSNTQTTTNTFHFEVGDFKFPKFYDQLCYDVKYTVKWDNKTKVATDDFLVIDNTNVRFYDFSILNNAQYIDLPASFKIDPREKYSKDENCN